jgi:hypothetical protein
MPAIIHVFDIIKKYIHVGDNFIQDRPFDAAAGFQRSMDARLLALLQAGIGIFF